MTKSKKVLNYWSKRATKRKLICTNDKLLEKYEFKFLNSEIKKNSKVLDIGCGDGSLLKSLQMSKNIKGVGIDFSNKLIDLAKKNSKNLDFKCFDMLKIKSLKIKLKSFDYILTKRSVQNLTTWKNQKYFINNLHYFCNKKTKIFLIESSKNSLININNFRKKLKLKAIQMPWHNLYFDDKKILKTKFNKIKIDSIDEIFSTYYFMSRVINGALAKKLNKSPQYGDFLNKIGWVLPQGTIKNFSQLKIYKFKKK
tara:strand:- start:2608 stop:3369 length:762 start_codon:yes stop_codon:yes gene_type:complete